MKIRCPLCRLILKSPIFHICPFVLFYLDDAMYNRVAILNTDIIAIKKLSEHSIQVVHWLPDGATIEVSTISHGG